MIDINMLSDRFSVRRLNDSNADDIRMEHSCFRKTALIAAPGLPSRIWKTGLTVLD